jgi:hypothetical protein
LTPDDRRRDVERKLGPPSVSYGGAAGLSYGARYPRLGLGIEYAEADATDPDNRIRAVGLRQPDASVSQTDTPAASRLAFRLVVENAGADDATVEMLADPDAPADGGAIAVRLESLLDQTAIADVAPQRDLQTGARSVRLTMSDQGARRLQEITSQNIGRRIAIVLDGRVLIAPTIRSAIARDVSIDLGPRATPEQAAEVFGRIHAAVYRMRPTSGPAAASGKVQPATAPVR